jgi:hypothetical protein
VGVGGNPKRAFSRTALSGRQLCAQNRFTRYSGWPLVSAKTRAPAHLKGSASVWRAVVADWSFRADELERLRLACEMLDQADDARLTVEREGAVTPDRFGQPKRHPALALPRC